MKNIFNSQKNYYYKFIVFIIIQNMKNNIRYAFTLVELIVVITILSILATVGFISFQWYSTESRDTKRITDISIISKWLQIFITSNSKLPDPSETQTIISSWSTQLIVQWTAGHSVLSTLKVADAKDPLDEKYYTYSTNSNRTKYQMMAMLENNPLSTFTPLTESYADYADRYAYIKWDKVWVLYEPITNIPLQYIDWITDIDLSTNQDDYIISFSTNNSSTSSWWVLYSEIMDNIWDNSNNIDEDNTPIAWSWRELDTNCQIDDFPVWNQIWAGCNSTLWNGLEWSGNTCGNYQWGNATCEYSASNNTELEFNSTYWLDNIWWKIYTWDNANNTACPEGWQLPSDQQWEELETTLNWGSNCRDSTDDWRCDGLGWKDYSDWDTSNNIIQALEMPLAGYRDPSWNFQTRWSDVYLWSSSEVDETPTNVRIRVLSWFYAWVNRMSITKNYGFSVRCIKEN